MKPTLIGSRALAYWNNSLVLKEDTDWDVISSKPIDGCEYHADSFLNNYEMQSVYSDPTSSVKLPNGEEANVMSMTGLAIIKRSHLWRNLSFDKHITHYHKFGLADYFVNCQEYTNRLQLTKEMFPQGHPNLMQSKEDFFNDVVKKIYDHDYLHECFAYYEKPIYTRILRQEGMAWCDESKWNTLSYKDKLMAVAEKQWLLLLKEC